MSPPAVQEMTIVPKVRFAVATVVASQALDFRLKRAIRAFPPQIREIVEK